MACAAPNRRPPRTAPVNQWCVRESVTNIMPRRERARKETRVERWPWTSKMWPPIKGVMREEAENEPIKAP